ncbi:MAG: hypothetical protein OEM67_13170 [Thermoleophilia bacterium]|nr:hypothetical protein [Thermoleophilia bacterium]MDH3724414.1 hypothetical protein [Thermoleophilia bacterium]
MFRRTSAGTRFETVAAAWGGLVPAIALIATSTQPEVLRLVIAMVAFAIGGFLCGIRATNRRAAHGVVAALIGVGIYVAFIGVTHVASWVGIGPEPFGIEPSEPARLAILVGVGVVTSGLAGALAGLMLSSAGASRIGA